VLPRLNPWLSARIARAQTDKQQRICEAQKTLLYTHLGVSMAAFLSAAISAIFIFPVRSNLRVPCGEPRLANVPPSTVFTRGRLQVIDADWARILLSMLYAMFAFVVGIAVAFWYYRRPPRLENVHQVRGTPCAMVGPTPRPFTRFCCVALPPHLDRR